MLHSTLNHDDLDAIDLNQLIPLVRKLVHTIGIEYTIALLKSKGGTPLYIPARAHNAQALLKILPMQKVVLLCKAMPMQWVELPKVDRILQQIRNQYIYKDRQKSSASKVAIKWGLTRRQVINICKHVSELPEQSINIRKLGVDIEYYPLFDD